MLLYMFAMGVLVVMKRKQKRDRLLREQFLNMPLPTVRRDDDHRGDQDNNDHRLLKDDISDAKSKILNMYSTPMTIQFIETENDFHHRVLDTSPHVYWATWRLTRYF